MISQSLEACPLWLLYKDHKSWESSKGTPPPTSRPVMGGNSGMNTHLSEILSWILEPLATSMIGDSSEVISGEDLKNKMDSLNTRNKEWKPEDQIDEPIGESSLMGGLLEEAPALCGCEDCSYNEASLGGEGYVNTQTGSVSVAGSQSNIVFNVCTENVKRGMMQNVNGLDDPKPIDVKSKACMSVAQLAKKYDKHEMCTCVRRVNFVCPLKARRPVIGRKKVSKTSHWTSKPSLYANSSSPSKLNISARESCI